MSTKTKKVKVDSYVMQAPTSPEFKLQAGDTVKFCPLNARAGPDSAVRVRFLSLTFTHTNTIYTHTPQATVVSVVDGVRNLDPFIFPDTPVKGFASVEINSTMHPYDCKHTLSHTQRNAHGTHREHVVYQNRK